MYDTGGNVFYMLKKSRWLYNGTLAYSNERSCQTSSDSALYNGHQLLDAYNSSDGRTHVLTYRGSAIYEFPNRAKFNLNTFIYYDNGNTAQKWQNTNFHYTDKKRAASDLYNFSLAYALPSTAKKMNGNVTYSFSYGSESSNHAYQMDEERDKTSDYGMSGFMNTLNLDFNSAVKSFAFSYGLQLDYNRVKDKVRYDYLQQSNNTYEEYFSGHEFLSGFYAQAKYSFSNQVSVRIGSRIEHTRYSYSLFNTDHNKSYSNVFPSLLASINLKNYSSTFGLVSHISRPKYAWMVYGERQANEVMSVYGNRDLKPNKIYGIIFYNTLFKYMFLNFSYILTYDCIGNVFSSDGKYLHSTYRNIADQQTFKLNLVVPFRFANKKVMGQIQLNLLHDKLYHFKDRFTLPDNREASCFHGSLHYTISYSPTERVDFSLDGNYHPTYQSPLMDTSANRSADIECQYAMLKNKNLLLRLTVNDLFAKDVQSTFYFTDGHYASRQCTIGPIFRLSLKYIFNKGQKVIDEYHDYIPSNTRFR